MRRGLVVGLVALLVAFAGAPTGLAQGGYSTARAKAYAAVSDWAGLLAYAQAWTRATPNDPEAWYALGRANGSKLYRLGLQRPADALPPTGRRWGSAPSGPKRGTPSG